MERADLEELYLRFFSGLIFVSFGCGTPRICPGSIQDYLDYKKCYLQVCTALYSLESIFSLDSQTNTVVLL